MTRLMITALMLAALAGQAAAQSRPAPTPSEKPDGEMRWALYVTLAPAWFDPGEVRAGVLTPFWVLYAMHDALVKPMPGNLMTPSLAESWTVSGDQRVYDFKLREGLRFHNGDAFTADDVKFSFQRSKAGKDLKDRVREVEVVGPARVRFHLHEPFPDFMAYYGTVLTGAGWIVPRKYVEKVGDEGFKKHPVGLGPYKFVSHTPGVELVLEAFEGYWRKMPHVKRLIMKTVPDPTTRAAMLKNSEVDIAYMLDAPSALELKRDPNFRLGFSGAVGIRMKMRTMERAAFHAAWAGKKVKGVCMCTLANFGNAATRLAEAVQSEGTYARGADPDVDALFRQQARETDRRKREAMLHQIQQLVYDRVRFGPLYEFIWPSGIGPRVAEPALLLIDPYPWSAPYEEVRLKAK